MEPNTPATYRVRAAQGCLLIPRAPSSREEERENDRAALTLAGGTVVLAVGMLQWFPEYAGLSGVPLAVVWFIRSLLQPSSNP